jgi:hypothetical protein
MPRQNLYSPTLGTTAPAIWNPNSAANWSLFFTPAFGAYLNPVQQHSPMMVAKLLRLPAVSICRGADILHVDIALFMQVAQ